MRRGPEAVKKWEVVLFGALILGGLELLNYAVKLYGNTFVSGRIPVRGRHLDELSPKDLLFIGLNKAATPPFVYFLLKYLYLEPKAVWSLQEATAWNVLFPLPALFLIYDFFYTPLHWALHIKAIYGYIHKHHHTQKAPSRANVDAVNVHPLEFFLGEYNHLFAVYLWSHCLNQPIHVLSVLLFLFLGGALASLNHTRFDVVYSLKGITFYDSKYHDVHHRLPQTNYGQYIMFWDILFGTFRDYNPNDRVHPNAQLDPKTGKTLHTTMHAKKN